MQTVRYLRYVRSKCSARHACGMLSWLESIDSCFCLSGSCLTSLARTGGGDRAIHRPAPVDGSLWQRRERLQAAPIHDEQREGSGCGPDVPATRPDAARRARTRGGERCLGPAGVDGTVSARRSAGCSCHTREAIAQQLLPHQAVYIVYHICHITSCLL